MKHLLLLCLIPLVARSQRDLIPDIQHDRVEIDVKIMDHVWYDGIAYQFIGITILGLPAAEANSDDWDGFAGAFSGPMRVVSRTRTIPAAKHVFEYQRDPVSNRLSGKVTGLFLLDDFRELSDSVLLLCRGSFGFMRQSQEHWDVYVTKIKMNTPVLLDLDVPIANAQWYRTSPYRGTFRKADVKFKDHLQYDHYLKEYMDHKTNDE